MNSTDIYKEFLLLINKDTFIQRFVIHSINQRVQEFSDPITTTLLLLVNTPINIVLCESGILPFKTNLLPVFPYGSLYIEEIKTLNHIVKTAPIELQRETVESSGQYTLTIGPPKGSKPQFICKNKILMNFVYVMFKYNNIRDDFRVCKTLCNIIVQRLMARVPISSDVIADVMEYVESCTQAEDSNNLILPVEKERKNIFEESIETKCMGVPESNDLIVCNNTQLDCPKANKQKKQKK
jgi:hypothetical protein